MFRIHRIVLETFVGSIPYGQESCHNDGNPANNKLKNLRYDTLSNNGLDRVKHGTQVRLDQKGEKNHAAKLNEQQVRVIRAFKELKNKPNKKELAEFFDISCTTIDDIWSYRSWKHLKD